MAQPSRGVTVLGLGGHARSVAESFRRAGWRATMVDFDAAVAGPLALGMVDTDKRRALIKRHGGDRFESIIDPSAVVSPSATLGRAVQILAGAIVQPYIRIGDFVVLNTGAQADHDCIIEDFAVIAPGAVLLGGVAVRNGAQVGANATVLPKIEIGRNAIVGAGAVVTRDVPHGATVVGNPARELRMVDAE